MPDNPDAMELEELMKQAVKPSFLGQDFKVTSDMAVKQPFDEDFECSICLNVFKTPII